MTAPLRIIGLHGKARTGKSSVASLLANRHQFWPLAFAWPIKLAGAATFDEPVRLWDSDETKEDIIPGFTVTRRAWMQDYGQWARDEYGADIWIRIAERRLEGFRTSTAAKDFAGVVISDVRHVNEADWIRHERGGEVWGIVRPGALAVRPHVSENGLAAQDIDRGIFNGGTLPELAQRVRQLLNNEEDIC
jgi:hypothetical protein